MSIILVSSLSACTTDLQVTGVNMNQKSAEYRFFMAAMNFVDSYRSRTGADTWRRDCTYCGYNSFVVSQGNQDEGILDYVMVSPNFEVASGRLLPKTGEFSDHHAVSVTVNLKEEAIGFSTGLIGRNEMEKLHGYFSNVSTQPYCWFSPLLGWTQKSRIKTFLRNQPWLSN